MLCEKAKSTLIYFFSESSTLKHLTFSRRCFAQTLWLLGAITILICIFSWRNLIPQKSKILEDKCQMWSPFPEVKHANTGSLFLPFQRCSQDLRSALEQRLARERFQLTYDHIEDDGTNTSVVEGWPPEKDRNVSTYINSGVNDFCCGSCAWNFSKVRICYNVGAIIYRYQINFHRQSC